MFWGDKRKKNDEKKLNFYNFTGDANLVTFGTTIGEMTDMPENTLKPQPTENLLVNIGGNYFKTNKMPAEIEFTKEDGDGSKHKVSIVKMKVDVFDDKNPLSEKDRTTVVEVPTVNELAGALSFNLQDAYQVENFSAVKKRPRPFSETSPLGGNVSALHCAKCANTIYDDNSHSIVGLESVTGNLELGKDNDGTDPNHTHWHIWRDPSQDGVYILAFRGTHMTKDQYIDVISDVSAIPIFVPLSLVDSGSVMKVGVHGGFFTGINNTRDEIYAALKERCPGLKTLYVTGHSLGAALSQVFLFFHLRDHAVKPFPYKTQTISFAAPQSIYARDPAIVTKLIEMFDGKSINFVFNRDVVPLSPRMLVNKPFLMELLKDAMEVTKTKLGVSNFFLSIVNTFTGSSAAASKMVVEFADAMIHTMGFSENYDVYHDTVHILKDKDRTVAVLQSAQQRNAWFRSPLNKWEVTDLTTSIMDHTCDNYEDAVGKLVQ